VLSGAHKMAGTCLTSCVLLYTSGIYVSLLESTAGESLSLLLKVKKEKADVDDVRRKMIDSAFYFIFYFYGQTSRNEYVDV
jgi:hypothetical protein